MLRTIGRLLLLLLLLLIFVCAVPSGPLLPGALAEESAAPAEESAAPSEETPAPSEETAAPLKKHPRPPRNSPAPSEETAAPLKKHPRPPRNSPAPSDEAAQGAKGSFAPLPLGTSPGYKPNPDGYLPDDAGYEDASISVQIETARAYETTILIARVKIADASQLRTAMSASFGSENLTYGAIMARRQNAVLAINADFYNYHSAGFLIRNGRRYRSMFWPGIDLLIIDDQGNLRIIDDANAEKVEPFVETIVHTFNFGPGLVIDGELNTELGTNLENNAPFKPTQRIAIAQTGPLSYLCVATEGPENKDSRGLTIAEFAQYMYELGCTQAYNLDGGSSSTMVLGSEKINALSSNKNRRLADIIYFATAVPSE